ncbi:MAG TPA: hypothetical protein DCS93_26260 [Microscillaceae bacterium]|nr:hypothetical protein [Microscillaceae bacterium]
MKKDDFDIKKFLGKRQFNVQEQVARKKQGIKRFAQYWRQHDLPAPLMQLLASKNIDINTSILIEYDQDYPGRNTDEGIILTEEGKFFEFEADLDPDRTRLITLELWEDVSHRYEINGRKKGIGKTFGFLALEVLKELNNKEPEE